MMLFNSPKATTEVKWRYQPKVILYPTRTLNVNFQFIHTLPNAMKKNIFTMLVFWSINVRTMFNLVKICHIWNLVHKSMWRRFFPPLNKWQFNTLIQHLSKTNTFFGKFHCIEISISMNSIWIINEWKKISNRCFIDANCFGTTGNTLTYFHFNTNQDMSIGTFFPFAMEKKR